MKLLTRSFVAVLFTMMAGTVSATPILSFDDGGAGTGTVSYDGSGSGAVGTNIGFSTILASGMSVNDGALLTCTNCLLNFTTGLNTAEGDNTVNGPDWHFATGGSLNIIGDVYDGATLIASGTLLTGNFLAADAAAIGSTLEFGGIGVDSKNADLLDFFGITAATTFIHVETALSLTEATFGANGSFNGNVTSADLANAVPEPAISALIGLGLLGFGFARRKAQ